MAIIVDEERSKVNIVQLAGWLGILGIVVAAIYYIFFAAPELVNISPPDSFGNIPPISQVTLQPEGVLNSSGFQALHSPPFPLPTPQGPAPVGRANPFVAP